MRVINISKYVIPLLSTIARLMIYKNLDLLKKKANGTTHATSISAFLYHVDTLAD